MAWDNCHHLLLQLQSSWTYWVMYDSYHELTLYNWASSKSSHRLLLQVQTVQEFGVVGAFGHPLLFYTRWNDTHIYIGGAINDYEGKGSLLFPIIVIGVYGQLWASCWIVLTKHIFSTVGLFGSIGRWVTFVTTLPSILGCIPRASTVSSSSYRPFRSFGS